MSETLNLNIEITQDRLATQPGAPKMVAGIVQSYRADDTAVANARTLGAVEGWAITALASKEPARMEAALVAILAAARASNGRRVIDGTYW